MSDAPSLRESAKRRAKPYRADWRFGVVNHLGDVWTPETFNTPDAALNYIAAAKAQNPSWDLSLHRVSPVKVTVSVSARKDGSSPQNSIPKGQDQ